MVVPGQRVGDEDRRLLRGPDSHRRISRPAPRSRGPARRHGGGRGHLPSGSRVFEWRVVDRGRHGADLGECVRQRIGPGAERRHLAAVGANALPARRMADRGIRGREAGRLHVTRYRQLAVRPFLPDPRRGAPTVRRDGVAAASDRGRHRRLRPDRHRGSRRPADDSRRPPHGTSGGCVRTGRLRHRVAREADGSAPSR